MARSGKDCPMVRKTPKRELTTVQKEAVKAAVVARRVELRFFSQASIAAASGISTTMWGLLESQGRIFPSRALRYKAAQVLQWPLDSFDRMAAGEPPPGAIPLPPEGEVDQKLVQALTEALRTSLEESDRRVSDSLDRLTQALEAAQRGQGPQKSAAPRNAGARRAAGGS